MKMFDLEGKSWNNEAECLRVESSLPILTGDNYMKILSFHSQLFHWLWQLSACKMSCCHWFLEWKSNTLVENDLSSHHFHSRRSKRTLLLSNQRDMVCVLSRWYSGQPVHILSGWSVFWIYGVYSEHVAHIGRLYIFCTWVGGVHS